MNKDNLQVAVIGLGTIGLSLCAELVKNNIKTLGIDIDDQKIQSLKNPTDSVLNDFLTYSNSYHSLIEADVLIYCLPTSFKNETPELSALISSIKSSRSYLKNSALIIIESTLYPGATKKEILPLLSGFTIGHDLFFSHSPERIDPGNIKYTLSNITKVVSGATPQCLDLAMKFYSLFLTKIHPVSSIEAAEMTKVLENYFSALNISMINEVKPICDKLNISIHEVIKAASSKEFNFSPFYPGPGIGGRCIPMAPVYMRYAAKNTNNSHQIIDSVIKANQKTINDTALLIKEHALKQNSSGNILLLGMTYKKNINDFRGSTAIEILENLKDLIGPNFTISLSDPYLDTFDKFYGSPVIQTNQITPDLLDQFTLVVLLMDHDLYDQEQLKNHSTFLSFK